MGENHPDPAGQLTLSHPRPAAACLACGSPTEALLEISGVPALCGVTWETASQARGSPSGPMVLRLCETCAHVFNAEFDPDLIVYDASYDNTLHHSPTFRGYARSLIERLDETYSLAGKHVVELGCGKGEFLTELCQVTHCRATGFDPSYEGVEDTPVDGLRFVREFMTADNAPEFDFFVSRHVLEHLEDPGALLQGVRDASHGREVYGYLEVPDARYDFERSGWDCIYPHVSYFSTSSLTRLVENEGFEVVRLVRDFGGQFLGAEVALSEAGERSEPKGDAELGQQLEVAHSFPDRYRQAVRYWRDYVDRQGPERVALWGAGARGVAFLNAVDPECRLGAVVDLNPAKWHRHLPLAGHRVIPPDELTDVGVASVVLTNPNYVDEVTSHLRTLGVSADVVCA